MATTDEVRALLERHMLDQLVRKPQNEFVLRILAVRGVARKLGVEPTRALVTRTLNALVTAKKITRGPGRKPMLELGPESGRKAGAKTKLLPVTRCFFPTKVTTPFAKARTAIRKRFTVATETKTSVAFQWLTPGLPKGPMLRLEATDLATLRSYMTAAKQRKLAGYTGCVMLAFDDLDEVLDEINTLIESQHVVATATGGPMYLAWNKKLVDVG